MNEPNLLSKDICQVFHFLEELIDTPDFLAMNMSEVGEHSKLIENFQQEGPWWSCFPFACTLLEAITIGLTRDKESSFAISILYGILKQHQNQIEDKIQLEKATAMYFPFIQKVCAVGPKMLITQKGKEWILSFLFILKNTERNLTIEWWKSEGVSRISSFLLILSHCTKEVLGNSFEVSFREECSVALLDICNSFYHTFSESFSKQGSPFIDTFLSIYNRLLTDPPTVFFHRTICVSFAVLVKKLADHIFNKKYNFCENFSFSILKSCTSESDKVREDVVSILLLMIRLNTKLVGNFALLKNAASLAISKLMSSEVCTILFFAIFS